MNARLEHLCAWWAGGDVLMPVMLLVALVLYALLGECAWRLNGPHTRRSIRDRELGRLVGNHPDRAWAAHYLALAEEESLTRGFLLIRTCTMILPLFGLLGTVSGMVDTFDVLARTGGSTAQRTSHGIGLALTATQYGMALAIPGMVGEWLLRTRVHTLIEQRTHAVMGAVAEVRRTHAVVIEDVTAALVSRKPQAQAPARQEQPCYA